MSEETKETQPQEAATPTEETQQVEPTAEESRDAHYEEQIEKLTEQLESTEKDKSDLQIALRQERDKRREIKAKAEQAKTLDPEELRRIAREEAEKSLTDVRIDMAAQVFDEELDRIAVSAKEKELIKLNYRDKIRQSGVDRASIRQDLILAKAASNVDRLRFEGAEPDAGLTTAMAGSGGKADFSGQEPEPEKTEADLAFEKKMSVYTKK